MRAIGRLACETPREDLFVLLPFLPPASPAEVLKPCSLASLQSARNADCSSTPRCPSRAASIHLSVLSLLWNSLPGTLPVLLVPKHTWFRPAGFGSARVTPLVTPTRRSGVLWSLSSEPMARLVPPRGTERARTCFQNLLALRVPGAAGAQLRSTQTPPEALTPRQAMRGPQLASHDRQHGLRVSTRSPSQACSRWLP